MICVRICGGDFTPIILWKSVRDVVTGPTVGTKNTETHRSTMTGFELTR